MAKESLVKKEKVKLPIDELFNDFTQHLSIPNNERIFFSAEFGAGKSYFLNEYFKENSDQYYCIHLSPVHYSIHDNMDVFKLIKTDILFHLIKNEKIEIDDFEFTTIESIELFAQANMIDVLNPLLTFMNIIHPSKEGAIANGMIAFFKTLSDKWEKHKKQLSSEKEKLSAEFRKLGEQFPEYLQEDIILQLISNSIKGIQDEKKKVVLVIDDLDRIDPAHIFRLLNVFSAWSDRHYFEIDKEDESNNRFDLDHIVMVGDIGNIEKVFHHVYGAETDFKGYMRKYFSNEVYHYSIKEVLVKNIFTRIKSIQYIGDKEPFLFTELKGNGVYKSLVLPMVDNFVKLGFISTRDLFQYPNLSFKAKRYRMFHKNGSIGELYNYNLIVCPLFDFFSSILGGEERLLKAIELSNHDVEFFIGNRYQESEKYYDILIPLVSIIGININKELSQLVKINIRNEKVEFLLTNDTDLIGVKYTGDVKRIHFNLFELLTEACKAWIEMKA